MIDLRNTSRSTASGYSFGLLLAFFMPVPLTFRAVLEPGGPSFMPTQTLVVPADVLAALGGNAHETRYRQHAGAGAAAGAAAVARRRALPYAEQGCVRRRGHPAGR